MKLNGKMLVVVGMMVGAIGATGCNKMSAQDDNAVAPEENPATAPAVEDKTAATPGVEQDAYWFNFYTGRRYYAPHAPPAMRVEVQGRAPSERHFWRGGYYRWSGREYVWTGGRWDVRRDGHEWRNPHWVNRSNRYEYVPGHWVRR
jgi:hypothetical protein